MPSHHDSESHVRWASVAATKETSPTNNNEKHNSSDDDDDDDDSVPATQSPHRHDSPHPVRPRAPTPSPPPHYPRSSSPSSTSSADHSSSDADDSSPTASPFPRRGRPTTLLDPRHALVSRATARRRAGPSSVDRGPHLTLALPRPAVTFKLPLPTPEIPLEDEDASQDPLSLLSHASTMSAASGIDLSTFSGHRDTFALLALHHLPRPAPTLPPRVFAHLASCLDASSYRALRLSCRAWSAGLSAAAPPRFWCSVAQRVPGEVLQMVYRELAPVDFNAARRACRGWMVAGLEGGVLERIVRRGGWWAGVLADRAVWREERRGSDGWGWEWEMGRRVGRECALGVGWTGSGFDEGGMRAGVKVTCVTEFAGLAGGEALRFTASGCGMFVLVVEGCLVCVYRLGEVARRGSVPRFPHGGSLEFYAKVVCPRRVVGVSMDTSSRRFAVAALLEDRTGMVVDLAASREAVEADGIPRQRRSIWGPEIDGLDALPSPEIGAENSAARMSEPEGVADNVHVLSYPMYQHPQVNHVAYHVAPLPASPSASPRPFEPTTSEPFVSTNTSSGHHLPSTPRTIYPTLGTPTSPPLSVAICPQRRCVAFGCATGIELHWVDALTGQDRSRWFPLTAPSDFLYFLPQRRGVDSARTLRLISSAGGAEQKGSLRHQFSGDGNDGRAQNGWKGDFGGLMQREDRGGHATSHYKATPLSDGETILYTDPSTSLLCLGSAAPPAHPTRLSRTFTFHGPATDALPTVYAAGSDLRWGVRVVAGYDSSLWLFSVPPDRFAEETAARRKRSVVAQTDTDADDVDAGLDARIAIPGVEIGRVEGLQDVAVDASGGGLTVWAFSAAGVAYTFQLDTGARRALRQRAVQGDGTVIDLVDSDGDVIMRDAPPVPSPPVFRTTDFDGAGSVAGEGSAGSLVLRSSKGSGERVVQSVGAVEVEMGEGDEGYWSGEEGAVGGGAFAIHVPRVEGWWSGDSGEWEVDYLGRG